MEKTQFCFSGINVDSKYNFFLLLISDEERTLWKYQRISRNLVRTCTSLWRTLGIFQNASASAFFSFCFFESLCVGANALNNFTWKITENWNKSCTDLIMKNVCYWCIKSKWTRDYEKAWLEHITAYELITFRKKIILRINFIWKVEQTFIWIRNLIVGSSCFIAWFENCFFKFSCCIK